MIKTRVFDVTDPAWPETLRALEHDVYHTATYLELEGERTGTAPRALLVDDGPNVFFLPYLLRDCCDVSPDALADATTDVVSPYGYPGFLLSDEARQSPAFLTAALRELKDRLRDDGACSAFLRLHPILNDTFDGIDANGFAMTTSETISIDLTLTEEQIWNHTRKGHRSTINKCIRLGFTPRMVAYGDFLHEFREIYEQTMSRVSAGEAYFFDDDYFAALQRFGDHLHLGIVEKDGQIAAACLFFEFCGMVQAHLGGTRSDFLALSPFHLVLHHARLWARARGDRVMHLGGGLGGAKDALHAFKSGFSKMRHRFSTLRIVLDAPKYDSLVRSRARAIGVTPESLCATGFFPAYRSPASCNEEHHDPLPSTEGVRS